MQWLKKVTDAANNALERAFYKLGFAIGSRPITTLVITAVLSAVCLTGLLRFRQESRPRFLWVPQDAEVLKERAFVEQHLPAKFSFASYIGTRPPANGDAGVLEAAVVKQLSALHERVLLVNASKDGEEFAWDAVAYRRSAGGNYWASSILALWNFNGTTINALTTTDILRTINQPNLLDPWNGGLFKVADILGGLQRDSNNAISGATAVQGFYRIIANETFDSGAGDEVDKRADDWQQKFESIVRGTWSQFSQMTVRTQFGFGQESARAINGDVRLLSIGYILILAYVIINLGRYNRLEHKFWLSLSGILSTGLAVGASFGLCSAFGLFYGPVHSVLPFLLLGIGVDDMFVIVQVWNNMSNEDHAAHTVPERLGMCLQHAGVSVTVTSITDLAAFLIGASTILPALQSFCIFAGIGVLFDFILQVTFFAATVALDAKRIDQRRDACCCRRLPESWTPLNIEGKWLTRYFRNYHAKALAKLPVKIAVILITAALAAVSIWAATKIEISFQFIWFLPGGSYVLDHNALSEQYFSSSGFRFGVYLGPVDYTSPGVQEQLDLVVNSTRYNQYVSADIPVDTWIEGLQMWPNATNLTGSNFYPTLTSYLSSSGARFSSALNTSTGSGMPSVQASSFSVNFVNLDNSLVEVQAMDSVRAAAASQLFPGGQRAFAYTRFFLGWTTTKVIDQELVRNLLLAMTAVFLVTVFLIANLLTSLYVLVCVALTVVDTIMVMHFWDLTINTVTTVVIILSIGLAVDYCAHVAHFFMTCQLATRQERVDAALSGVGVAVFNGGFSTFLAFVLLSASTSYIFLTFFKIFLSVVIFGLWHGLVFLPVVLSFIGPASHSQVGELADAKQGTVLPMNGDIQMQGKKTVMHTDSTLTDTGAGEENTEKWAVRVGDSTDSRYPELV